MFKGIDAFTISVSLPFLKELTTIKVPALFKELTAHKTSALTFKELTEWLIRVAGIEPAIKVWVVV